jgi:hypothetical protein
VDSDDEWEEEEPGESLHGSDDEKESEDDYEVDNEFMVRTISVRMKSEKLILTLFSSIGTSRPS